ncbi:MAG: peptidylprolyl isomerase [Pseudomonadota bacterium]|nr:peptidylprolyl isomerase [Pseudomonadota bacterium]
MLQKLRDKTTGLMGAAILAVLIVPFALFGLDQYMVQGSDNAVAKIEAPPSWWQAAPAWWPVSMFWQQQEVTSVEYRARLEQVRQQQREQLGDAYDPREFESIDNKRLILDSLIDEKVLALASQDAGVVVSDALVRKTIQEIEGFQVEGKFNPDRYQLTLASQVPPQTPREFERFVRENLQKSLAATGIGASSFVTTSEMDRLVRLMGERRDASLLMLPPPAPDTAAVSAAEIQAWYAANTADYRAPESVTIEYVELNAETMPAPPVADEVMLRQRYEQEQSRFLAQEERLASHILVRVEEGADATAQAAAEAKATQLAAQARAPGADFAALARTSSDDTGSSASGGDLGWIGKGMMPGPFENALYALQSGQISAPVKTDFGWHVIQLRQLKSGAQESFEEARDVLAQEQAVADRERSFNELSSKLLDLVYRNPSSLAPAARELNLPVQTLGPFTRASGEGIAATPAVKRLAFSEALIQDGTASDPIEIGPGHSVMIRVVAHTPETVQPLVQVRDRVIAEVRTDRARKAANQRADALLARLRGGETLETLATAEALPAPETVPDVPRGTPLPEPVVTEAIFAAATPAANRLTSGKAVLSDGRTVLFVVSKVTPGDASTIDAQQRAMLQEQFAQISGIDDMRALSSALRQRMKIKVVEANL